jgi:transaldolase/glucose-6-phosphate isomerase
VLYVEEIIGRDTVNTMPPATVTAFQDHGEVEATIEQDVEGAKRALRQLEELGIHMAEVTQELLDEGVKLFAEAFDTLMSVINGKREALRDNIAGREQASLGDLQAAVNSRLAALAKADAVRKIWNKDPSYWGLDPESDGGKAVKSRSGWLTVTDLMLEHADDLQRFGEHVKAAGFKQVIFCGSAGINPAVEVYGQAFSGQNGNPHVRAMHAEAVAKLDSLSADTLVIHAGKAATTPLQKSAHEHLWSLQPHGDHYVMVTSASTGLGDVAQQHKFRRLFLDPEDIAGEFGAFSYLGLVAGAAGGMDAQRLLSRAEHVVHDCMPMVPPEDNAGAWFGAILGEAALAGRKKITIICPPAISAFGKWAAQMADKGGLQAEAITAVNAPASYGADRLFIYERLGHELDGDVEKLRQAGQPVVTFTLRDRFDLGEEIFRWEFAAAVAGGIVGVNPFRSPATH